MGDLIVRSALSWSGGKDSALTLWALRRQGVEPEALITTVTDEYDRISMHGVRRELLARQADAIGAPLVEVRIDDAEIDIDLQPGELLLFDNLVLAHGRRGTRQPGELRQRVFGHRLQPADQRKLRDRVLTAFDTRARR